VWRIRNTAENSKLKWSLLSHRPRTKKLCRDAGAVLRLVCFIHSAPRHHRLARERSRFPSIVFARHGIVKPHHLRSGVTPRSRSRSLHRDTAPRSKMPPRLPAPADFPPHLILDIIPPSTGAPVNVLILFHGLGDTKSSFSSLGTSRFSHPSLPRTNPPQGKNLNLPSTAIISLQGFNPIPPLFTGTDEACFHWGDDVLVDERTGEIEVDSGFEKGVRILDGDVVSVLKEKCGYEERNIHFLGYGQGGMLALLLVAEKLVEYGGCISIGGALPSSSSSSSSSIKTKAPTPVLICGGNSNTRITRSRVEEVKGRFREVEYVRWERGGDGMPARREEMLPLMRFWGRRLRMGGPEGSFEL
jgi:predicted esterase